MKTKTQKSKKLLLIAALFAALFAVSAFAITQNSAMGYSLGAENTADETFISRATIEDDFYPCSVFVVLTREASLDFNNTITPLDFPEIDAVSVKDLTQEIGESVRRRRLRLTDNSGIRINIDDFRRILRIELEKQTKENVINSIRLLEQRPDVRGADPNFKTSSSSSIASPDSAVQGFFGPQWAFNRIQLQNALYITNPVTDTVLVGVIDFGIDGSHPSLTNQIHRTGNIDTTLHRRISGGVLVPEIEPTYTNSHGTEVSGVVASMSPNIRLVSLLATGLHMVHAITFATGRIPILNISLYLPNGLYSSALTQAITMFDGLIVVSANNQNRSTNINYPANYTQFNDRFITVGATAFNNGIERRAIAEDWGDPIIDPHFNPNFASNFGDRVDIFAPGTAIRTTSTQARYVYNYGTSFASPMVAGAAAKVMMTDPSLSRQAVIDIILNNSDTIRLNGTIGAEVRRLNIYRAVNYAYYAYREIYHADTFITEILPYFGKQIVGTTGISGSVRIPSRIFGVPVIAIGEGAFANQTGLTSVIFPSAIRFIGAGAFADNDLQSIRFQVYDRHSARLTIREYAFANNPRLIMVKNIHTTIYENIPQTNTQIGVNAFANTNARIYVAPNNNIIHRVPTGIFQATGIRSVVLPYCITYIGPYAFADNPLESITLLRPPLDNDYFTGAFTGTSLGSTNAFSGVNLNNLTIFVPCEISADSYRAAPNWNNPTIAARISASRHEITISPLTHRTFPQRTIWQSTLLAHTVTVANTGNRPTGRLNIRNSNESSFELCRTSIDNIAPPAPPWFMPSWANFTVRPRDNLPAGTHVATITITGENNLIAFFTASITVVYQPASWGFRLSSFSHTFAGRLLGQEMPLYYRVHIINTGNQPLGLISITADYDYFVFYKSGSSFTVIPSANLGIGVHTTVFTITNERGDYAFFSASITIFTESDWDLFYKSAACLGHQIELDTPNIRLIIEFFDSDYSVSVSVGYYVLYMDVNTHLWINWFCYYSFRHATVSIHFINPLTLYFELRGGSEPNFNAKFSVRVYVPGVG